MIKYVSYKNYSVNSCEHAYKCNQTRTGFWLIYASNYVLIYCNRNFFQKQKINPTLFCDDLRSGGDVFMIFSKDDIQKCGWCLITDLERSWWVGQKFLFLMCSPTGQPIGKWVGLFNQSSPLVKGSGYKTPPPVWGFTPVVSPRPHIAGYAHPNRNH